VKQIVQNYRTGDLQVREVPVPGERAGHLLVHTVASLVSAGTEKLMLDMAKKSLLGKARARPDLVRQVVNKAREEGAMEAYKQTMSRLDAPFPLGYCSAGSVLEIGSGVEGFQVGDLVACSGTLFASHAEVVSVPANLCARVPAGVDPEAAAFTTLGAIALQAVRVADPRLGENVVVIGLGLIGQLAVQLLKANGCRVFGIDPDPKKVGLALLHGADAATADNDQALRQIAEWSRGYGADAVLIAASTDSNGPVELAGELARERGRVSILGAVGIDLPRKVYYEKELEVTVSRAWGPGLPEYETRGAVYPVGYVRWTAQRNMEAFLDLLAAGSVTVDRIISHRFPIEQAEQAYELVTGKTGEPFIGVLLTYPTEAPAKRILQLKRVSIAPSPQATVRVGVIGAGLFGRTTLLPSVAALPGVSLHGLATAGGVSAVHTGEKFDFSYVTTDYQQVLDDPDIDCLLIATRHNLHARLAAEGLRRGKHVFVEKPLALDEEQLRDVVQAAQGNRSLMAGFNRRFSPDAQAAVEYFQGRTYPLLVTCRVNAGAVPPNSWVNDATEGGGRIVGEVCHFVDLLQFLTGSLPTEVSARGIRSASSGLFESAVISLAHDDGSVGVIVYASEGDKAYERERVEIFGGGAVFAIENFKGNTQARAAHKKSHKRLNVDRGHDAELKAFFESIRRGTPPPISLESLVATTLATFRIEDALNTGQAVPINWVSEGAS